MIIKYFSWIKEHIGKSEELIELPDDVTTVSELINYLNNLIFLFLNFLNFI